MPNMDDPFKLEGATVVRPRPGAGRRAGGDPAHLQPAVSAADYGEPVPVGAHDLLAAGLNPLVQAASSLLLLAPRLRGTLTAPDLPGLRRHALDSIRQFEERVQTAGIAREVALATRYVLCATIDEAVMSTPWGKESEWSVQPLLIVLHREADGGEKFFQMLDRISQDPTRHIDLMELQYLCLAFGFAGKYQLMPQGHARLAEVQHTLYQKIRAFRGTAPPELSLRWQGVQDRRNRLVRYVPWWVVGVAALLIMTLVYGVYYALLDNRSESLYTVLANVGRELPPTVANAPVPPQTLKELLKGEEDRGVLRVEEEGGGLTRITLTASDLFASGSATPNPAYTDMFRTVAAALNKVPGPVRVEGHTDDQPLRSLTFRNNFELSQKRAENVAASLAATIDNRGRIDVTGLGSSEQRYKPDVPDYRARNRRVEIIHVRGF